MRPDLMEILCCPVCKGDLTLTIGRQQGEEVLEGSLGCARCPAAYPITDGIPDLLPPDQRD
jgi:uncharacterized protein YbaR (Trm112 family)